MNFVSQKEFLLGSVLFPAGFSSMFLRLYLKLLLLPVFLLSCWLFPLSHLVFAAFLLQRCRSDIKILLLFCNVATPPGNKQGH